MIYGLRLSLLISDTDMKRENQEQNDQNGQNNGNDYINQNNEPSPKRCRNDEEEIRLLIPSKVNIVNFDNICSSEVVIGKFVSENILHKILIVWINLAGSVFLKT